jgi:DNA primase
MSLYTKDSIDRLKDAVDMVELVGARTDLRRVGTRYTGLCPFHEERTPSFSVNAEHKLYHCFGCGESGDAIGFVQETEGLDFRQAVEALAERYNVELKREQEDPAAERRRERRERLLKLVERATDYYARYLWDSSEAGLAREYLSGRGLGEEVLRQFRVGYAPSAWDKVTVAAQRDGFTREEIAAAGLAQRSRGGSGFYDRFRARIMFPLADPRGKVLGFGARAVREGPKQAKYINTSDNELYHKGRQLFGINLARGPAAKLGRILVVEGYTDVLALHQAGLTETVAIMGTAVTPEQVTLLSQTTNSVFLALDADRSGQEAMLRAAKIASERGVELRVVEMPDGTDPAELVTEHGAEAFTELLGTASSVVEFQVRRVLADSDLQTPRGRDRALEAVRPLIVTADSPATRDHLVRYVADKLDLAPEVVTTALQSAPRQAPQTQPSREAQRRPERLLDGASRAERAFLAMCLSQGEIGKEYLARVTDGHLSSEALRLTRDHLLAHFADPLADRPADDPAIAATITEVVMLADEEPSSEPALRLGFLQLELRRIERELRHAGQGDDFDRQRELWSERENVREAIGNVMGETP